MHSIEYHFESIEIPDFNPEFFSLWLEEVAKTYAVELKELCYVFCSDEYLLAVNQEHLNHDYYTDIITFNYCEDKLIAGDLFISVDRVMDNSKEYNVLFVDELSRVMVHGLLHLIGFDDKTPKEKEVMRSEETKCLILNTKVSRET